MAQAKTLTQAEIDQVLRYTSKSRYAVRNRCLILTSFWSGMRVAEIANLKMRDVLNFNHLENAKLAKMMKQTSILLTLNSKKVGIPDIYHEDIQVKRFIKC